MTTNDEYKFDLEQYNDVHVLILGVDDFWLRRSNVQNVYDGTVDDAMFVDREHIFHKVCRKKTKVIEYSLVF